MTLCWADSMTANSSTSHDSFHIERHGDIAVFTPSPDVEEMPEDLIHQAAEFILGPLREDPPAGLVIDLSQVEFFGSIFISFLLRCHMVVKKHGSDVVVAGANERLRELMHVTALDTLWALYDSRSEALEALAGSD